MDKKTDHQKWIKKCPSPILSNMNVEKAEGIKTSTAQKPKRKNIKKKEKYQPAVPFENKTNVTESGYNNNNDVNKQIHNKNMKEMYRRRKEYRLEKKKEQDMPYRTENEKSNNLPAEQKAVFQKVLENLQRELKITPQELKQTLTTILFSENADSKLYDFLGPTFISEMEILLANRHHLLMTNQNKQKHYTEIVLPPTPLLTHTDRKENSFKIFPYKFFNTVQSRVLTITQTENNFLLAAPTGSGKTDVACLCIYRNSFREISNGSPQENSSPFLKDISSSNKGKKYFTEIDQKNTALDSIKNQRSRSTSENKNSSPSPKDISSSNKGKKYFTEIDQKSTAFDSIKNQRSRSTSENKNEHRLDSENHTSNNDSTPFSKLEKQVPESILVDTKNNTVYVVPLRALATEITKKLREKFSCTNCARKRRDIDHFITHGRVSGLKSDRNVPEQQYARNEVLQDMTFGEIPQHVLEKLHTKYSCLQNSVYDLPCLDVMEYTGDTPFQPLMARIVVTTPEKLDGCSRKLSFSYNFSLMIIDEIHLLEEERGAVIETLVARFRDKPLINKKNSDTFFNPKSRHVPTEYADPPVHSPESSNRIRIVGLSATVTNTTDVAQFLDGPVFHFDDSFRQVPLKIHLIGAKEIVECSQAEIDERRNSYEWSSHNTTVDKKGVKNGFSKNISDRGNTDKDTYDRRISDGATSLTAPLNKNIHHSNTSEPQGDQKNQFSEKGSKKRHGPAKDRNKLVKINNFEEILVEKLLTLSGQTLVFVNSRYECYKTASLIIRRIILRNDKQRLQNKSTQHDLDHFLRYGIGIHNAGMPRASRQKVEMLFLGFKLKYVICTKTLAWGLNMPARNVVLFKTKYYSDGRFRDVSMSDVLQIVGRAGRIDYIEDKGGFLSDNKKGSKHTKKHTGSSGNTKFNDEMTEKSPDASHLTKKEVISSKDSSFYPQSYKYNDMASSKQDKNIGIAFIITDNLNFYTTKLKTKPPIESTLLTNMINCLNSQVGLEPCMNLDRCLKWFKRTFLYIRGFKSPSIYGFNLNDDCFGSKIRNGQFNNETFQQVKFTKDQQKTHNFDAFQSNETRFDNSSIVDSNIAEYQDEKSNLYETVIRNLLELAIKKLRSCNLITKTDPFQSTWEGRIASYYYIDFRTIGKIVDFLNVENPQAQLQGLNISETPISSCSQNIETVQTDKETRTNHQALFDNHFKNHISQNFSAVELLILNLLLNTKEFSGITVRSEESESIIREIEHFTSHKKSSTAKNRPSMNDGASSQPYFNVSEISVSPCQKLLFLLHQFLLRRQPTIFSLISDTHFLRKNLTRLLAAFEQTCLLKEHFDTCRVAFILRRRIEGKNENGMSMGKQSHEDDRSRKYIKLKTKTINGTLCTQLDVQMNRDESFLIFISQTVIENAQFKDNPIDFAAVFHNKSTFYFSYEIKHLQIQIHSDSSSFSYNTMIEASASDEVCTLQGITGLIPYNLFYKRERLALIDMDLKRMLESFQNHKILVVHDEMIPPGVNSYHHKNIMYIAAQDFIKYYDQKSSKKNFNDLKNKTFNHIFIAGCFSLEIFILINKIKSDEITILDRNDICEFIDSIVE